MSIYNFDIQYRPSSRMGNADFCSRFPLKEEVPKYLDEELIRNINFGREFPIDSKKIAEVTRTDEFLMEIIKFIKTGWPKRVDKRFVDVCSNQHELEIIDDCLLYQDRVVIPQVMQSGILKLLHANHAGVVKMKLLARRSVYWFGINKDIENFAKQCDICSSMTVAPKQKIESKWTPTTRPFSRLHIDFFYFEHRTFLLVVDSFSKWIEVEYMKSGTDSGKVLRKLVAIFARFGLPDVLVSDGGPPFNSYGFVNFLEKQGIKVFKSPPYNPSSNGQAERLVRTVKDVLKKFLMEPETKELNWEDQLNLFLFNYRNSCLTNGGDFPSERIFNYTPMKLIDLLNPKRHYKKQLLLPHPPGDEKSSKPPIDNNADPYDNLMEGDVVWYKNHNPHDHRKWLKANFLKRFSKNTFQILIGNVPVMAHRIQMRISHTSEGRNPMISWVPCEDKRSGRKSLSNEEDFRGFPEHEQERKGEKRKFNFGPADLSDSELRRSKRLRRANFDTDFVYK
ncbi:uncharacterized protein K02A2.6-like [Malaya genurostris]|uniref:uncharacterized protein K02A2.6-like n=1 Tax=Malaya genurostris TaxID=325434 RepID=UPI0026F3D7E1|nr:uncharacterized protein K02A2.6-like [Malaya genurostris]